jgi:uncharacterized membrane protein
MGRMAAMRSRPQVGDDVSTSRLESFSDGVIAIIVTIMVLDLRAPEAATTVALLALWPIFFSYALSFLVVAIYWVNHRHVVRYATHVTPALLWLNMATLFTISLIPFATAWLGAHLVAPLPNVVYGLVLIASAVSFLLLSEVVNRQNAAHREYAHVILIARAKGLIALALYVTGVALAALVPGALLFAAGAAALMYFVPTAAPKVKPP